MGRTIDEQERILLERIGAKLKKYRKGKTQSDVSKEIGISDNDISQYERGKKDISILTLNKFCKYYKITMSNLIYNIQTPPKTELNNELTNLKHKLSTFSKEANNIIQKIENLPKD